MPKRMLNSGAGFPLTLDPAQRGLHTEPLAAPLLLSKPVAYSHGPAIAADSALGASVARRSTSVTTLHEGPLFASAIEARPAQSEGPEPGPQGAPDESCVLQCLYMAHRCARRCEGCIVTASTARAGRAEVRGTSGAGGPGFRAPPSNTGANNAVEGVDHGG